jgi:hypothetical protein
LTSRPCCGAARLVAAHSADQCAAVGTTALGSVMAQAVRSSGCTSNGRSQRRSALAYSLVGPCPLPAPARELHTFMVAVVKAETVAEPRSRVFVCRAADVQLGPADRSLSAIAVDSSARSWKGRGGAEPADFTVLPLPSPLSAHRPACLARHDEHGRRAIGGIRSREIAKSHQ